jgi:imidazolonepropionase-like amidohydrolase
MWTSLASAAGALSVAIGVAFGQQPQGSLVLVGGRVLDAAAEKWVDGAAVVVVGARIVEVGRPEAAPEGAVRIDATGLFILPGLIDLHTHLLLRPYDQAKWDDQVLKESLELRTIRAVGFARATVEAGFTTIRDLGTEGAGWADVALREAVAEGLIPGPRIFTSTRAIVAASCYGPAGFDPRWDVPQGAQEVSGAEEMRRAVREQIAAGADWVKVYADYRRQAGDAATPTLSLEELRAAVDEARSAGKPVAAHATSDGGIRRAVEAGVNTIEHGYGATRQTLELMRDRRVVLCPTMAAAEAVAIYAGWKPGEQAPQGVVRSHELVQMAREVGVTIACGSDAGVFAHGSNGREIELMVEAGMSPAEAIRAATSIAAGVVGRQGDLGRIERGFVADLVCVRGDPLAGIARLRQVVIVIAAGRVVVRR